MLAQSERAARRQLSLEDEKALQDAILSIVEQRRGELVQEVGRQGHPDPERRIGERTAAQVAVVIIWREMRNDERRAQTIDRLSAHFSPEAQDYLNELDRGQRAWQLMHWVNDAMGPKVGRQNLEEFFTNELTNDQREYLLGLPSAEMREQLQQMYMRSQVGLRDDDFPRRFWRDGPGGRGPWERERGGRDAMADAESAAGETDRGVTLIGIDSTVRRRFRRGRARDRADRTGVRRDRRRGMGANGVLHRRMAWGRRRAVVHRAGRGRRARSRFERGGAEAGAKPQAMCSAIRGCRPNRSGTSNFVAVAVFAVDDLCQRRVVQRLEIHRIPFDAAALPDGQVAEQDRLGERAGVVGEVRHRRLLRVAHGDEPFLFVAGAARVVDVELLHVADDLNALLGVVAGRVHRGLVADRSARRSCTAAALPCHRRPWSSASRLRTARSAAGCRRRTSTS